MSAYEPAQRDGRGAEQRRPDLVRQYAAHAEHGGDRQEQHVQRRMIGGCELPAEELVLHGRDEALAVREEVGAVVVEERIAEQRRVTAETEHVHEPHREPDPGDHEHAPREVVARHVLAARHAGSSPSRTNRIRRRDPGRVTEGRGFEPPVLALDDSKRRTLLSLVHTGAFGAGDGPVRRFSVCRIRSLRPRLTGSSCAIMRLADDAPTDHHDPLSPIDGARRMVRQSGRRDPASLVTSSSPTSIRLTAFPEIRRRCASQSQDRFQPFVVIVVDEAWGVRRPDRCRSPRCPLLVQRIRTASSLLERDPIAERPPASRR